ncbi:YggS family pyridoxal phosphate-dependent enzyme [Kitasatospora purpeofusca]|uniref:YggS family pyridoxal phosphate-dependent enzyme n=1 Tax=Kitasatospora purpeofusca TaxID=67352 RepID=UPI002257FA1B|nr:YggS family pyridoxal phosphate-dependent enzyme [Kitasatospora purpeofusca]MCX4752262.1 YggS family pyridoxal phosphate-dependent enzyme [Kitasatospora purpeofusca]WSR31848.1 YggS family pyridoxal phosphate-dependent enzyme [Kitasatospora purpeofusca]WSR39875.1 YggS family pyridoxal phosphate-dependent enzyme [Kitasatospora purpeofusca]
MTNDIYGPFPGDSARFPDKSWLDALTEGQRARYEELGTNLEVVERRIADACAAVGRARDEVRLIVVTKTYPAEDTALLAGLGATDVAENRDQDAAPKAEQCRNLPLVWHFVGQLQTNKVRSVVRYADHVHSVDRARLVESLGAAVTKAERADLGCLVQVALDKEAGEGGHRAGVAPADVLTLADAIADTPGLRMDGVMTVAPLAGPLAGDPASAFDRLAEIATAVRAAHPAATMVSAGMSGDLEQAIAAGATHVRVGTAVLGVRSPLR